MPYVFDQFQLLGRVPDRIWDDNLGLQPTGTLPFVPAQPSGSHRGQMPLDRDVVRFATTHLSGLFRSSCLRQPCRNGTHRLSLLGAGAGLRQGAPISGTKRVKWLEQNAAALDVTLTAGELSALGPLVS